MLKIGLTGGIGSGKSTVAGIFGILGVPVFFADREAQLILHSDPSVQAQVISLLGEEAFSPAGVPNRKYIAAQIFGDPELLKHVDAVIHPAVFRQFDLWCAGRRDVPYVVQEAAILFESGGARYMDENIVVWAPEAVRLERVMQRDRVTEQEVRARMHHQLAEKDIVRQAQFVIINDGMHPLIRQVMEIHQVLLHKANERTPVH